LREAIGARRLHPTAGMYQAPDPVKEGLDRSGIYHFFRGQLACALSRSAGEFYWGHVGFPADSPYRGRLFVKAAGVRLYNVRVPLTGNRSLDDRWWLGFEGTSPMSYRNTLDELKAAADFLQRPLS
jgi:hypothetical protein